MTTFNVFAIRKRFIHVLVVAALTALSLLMAMPTHAQSPATSSEIVTPVPAEHQSKIKVLLDAANVAYLARDWLKAIDGYTQVISTDPKQVRAIRWRSATYREMGQYEFSIKDSKRVIDIEPNESKNYSDLCWTLILANQPDKAQTSCIKAQQLDPLDMVATVNLAHTYLLQGKKLEAWRWYEQTIGLLVDEQQLTSGLLEDFNIFEKRGWEVALVKQARREFEPKARQWILTIQPLTQLLRRYSQAKNDKDFQTAVVLADQYRTAIAALLPEAHPHRVRANEALTSAFNSLGVQLLNLSKFSEAVGVFQRGLVISEFAHGADSPMTATFLGNLATVYKKMGRHDESLGLLKRDLEIRNKNFTSEPLGAVGALIQLADYHYTKGEYGLALDNLLRAKETVGTKVTLPAADVWANLAAVLTALYEYDRAENFLKLSISMRRKIQGSNYEDKRSDLNTMASIYLGTNRFSQAIHLFQRQYITDVIERSDLTNRTHSSNNLMVLHSGRSREFKTLSEIPLAIWYGKQSINALQSIRTDLKALEKESQQSFLKQNQAAYEYLANLLIEDNRLAEAEQVLAMLKDQELQELTRSGAESNTAAIKQVEYSGAEIALSREFETLSKQASAANSEREALKTRQSQGETLGAADQARIAELDMAVEANRKAFDTFMARLQTTLAPSAKSPQTKLAAIPNGAPKMEALLRSAGAGHVGLQYVVTEDRLSILFSTPEGTFARQINLEKDQLKTLVLRLKDQLKTPDFDPQPTTLALHKLLIEPIAPELAAAKAHTLVLNLTDFLRYIPFGALHDGKSYLLERYAVALYTPASNQAIAPFDAKAWQVAGMGATRATKFEDDNASFKALPAVRGELAGIVRTSSTPGGALPGQITLDPDFTQANFSTALTKFPVVHVASHYQFAPNSEHRSYLVLGDGNRLSLAELNRMDFTKVQLLALSACDTASGGGRNEKGSEIEGLGAAVQRRGAKAVLATLWPVADESTASVMQRFYQLRSPVVTSIASSATNTASTALALRQAQLELLTGQNKLVPSTATLAARSSAEGALSATPANTRARPYMHDPDKPFAHPYYWAPFILMGNWL